jgi:hypothetical protein
LPDDGAPQCGCRSPALACGGTTEIQKEIIARGLGL